VTFLKSRRGERPATFTATARLWPGVLHEPLHYLPALIADLVASPVVRRPNSLFDPALNRLHRWKLEKIDKVLYSHNGWLTSSYRLIWDRLFHAQFLRSVLGWRATSIGTVP
jgi:hypothetical protein